MKNKSMWRNKIGAIVTLTGLLSFMLSISASTQAVAVACAVPSPSYGSDTLSVAIPSTGTYYVWLRMLSPGSGSNGILLQVDTASCYAMGGASSMPTNSWTWVNYQNGSTGSIASLSLSQGTHAVTLLGNKAGVEVDRIELLGDPHCTPTGTGDNCVVANAAASTATTTTASTSLNDTAQTNSSATTLPTTDGAQTTVNAPVEIVPSSIASNKGELVKAEYYLNGKLIATRSAAPFDYQLQTQNYLNGTYTLITKLYYTSGTTSSTSQKITIKNPASFKQFTLTAQKYAPVGGSVIVVLAIGAFLFIRFRPFKKSPIIPLPQFVPQPTEASYQPPQPAPYAPPAPQPLPPQQNTPYLPQRPTTPAESLPQTATPPYTGMTQQSHTPDVTAQPPAVSSDEAKSTPENLERTLYIHRHPHE